MSQLVAWTIIGGAIAGLIAVGSILNRPILDLKRPTPARVALLGIILTLLVILAIAAYWAIV